MEHTYSVIMAGGKGERFWPLSTKQVPKPFVRLFGDKTMIQMTVERMASVVPTERVCVVIGEDHLEVARKQLPMLPEENFIVEPAGRDTAACIGFTAVTLMRRDPEALMIVLPADHYIPDVDAFVKTVKAAHGYARSGEHLVTIGIRPVRPETGYGYIHAFQKCDASEDCICYRVKRFVEKPDAVRAAHYLAEGRYYWNSGIFVWRARTVLKGIESHMPNLYRGLMDINDAMGAGDRERVASVFGGLERISIDYGLMEKVDNGLMVEASFPWDDVGTWSSFLRVSGLDEDGNYVQGSPICIDTKDCVIFAENTKVGVIGLSNVIVVASREGVLVCDMKRDQEARKIASSLDEDT